MNGVNVGEIIKQLRKEKGISQNQLAKTAKISQAGLSAIESGAASPSIQTLSIIADALGVPVSHLVDDESVETQPVSDPDIRILERAKEKMSEDDWQNLMKAIKAFYPQFFEQ